MIELNAFVIVNIAILATLLLFRKNNALPNKILALIFIIPGLNFANNIVMFTGNINTFPYSFFIVQGTAAFFAPLVYYYILLLIGAKIRYQKILFLISGLLVCFNIYLAIEFALKSKLEQNAYMDSILNGPYPEAIELYSLAFFVLQLVYFSLGAWAIVQYGRNLKNTVSDLEHTKIKYLKQFITLFWVLTFVTILLYASIETVKVEYFVLPLVISCIYVFVLYYAFHANAVFTQQSFKEHLQNDVPEELLNEEEEEDTQPKDNKILFPEDLPAKIEMYLNEHKIFKDTEINLQKFAEQLDIPPYQVSKAINLGLGTSFYEMINKKRVEEAQVLLTSKDLKKHTIEGIAYESGFNSRTAFYRAFKKHLGKSPSEFMEN